MRFAPVPFGDPLVTPLIAGIRFECTVRYGPGADDDVEAAELPKRPFEALSPV